MSRRESRIYMCEKKRPAKREFIQLTMILKKYSKNIFKGWKIGDIYFLAEKEVISQ